ncbi:putative Nucleic acid-binding, OB-fold-like protein [Hibiscus syriacus]|uniref:Nucleic acid-binding, OB-fold-like protein n=1 Tax=Hibiscus syriacus TaxID=106335 RepID=A0A6A2WS92_HIBSY|nr:putative Nucleic acid-binding, OB-fold-like protein [Hibiscus syriacus]
MDQSCLMVAGARKVDNEVIRTSVAEIRELAYDVEDVLETFSLKVASKRKSGFSNCIKGCGCFLKEVCLLHRTKNMVDAKLKQLGEEMVKHCARLPLAVVTLGGMLVTKDNPLNEWLKVSANVKSYLKRGKSEGPEDVLALSYDDLPPYLRPCFLYSSHFPDDYEISVDRLNQLWVAKDAEINELPKYNLLSPNLAYVKLSFCRLEEDPMPTLEKLPNLRILKLDSGALVANKILCSAQGFPKLESLEVKCLENLEEWNVEEGALPSLPRIGDQILPSAEDGSGWIEVHYNPPKTGD